MDPSPISKGRHLLADPRFIAVGCGLFAALVYGHVVTHEFVYDDVPIIGTDHRLESPGYILDVWTAPWWDRAVSVTITRPLTSATFWAQVQLHGRTAWPFFAVNVAIYSVLCAIVALLARSWLGRASAGWVIGLAFAAHPLHVEAVGNAVGRAELLACLFIALGLWLWLRWRGRWTWPRAIAIAGCVAAAGLSKEHGYLLAPMLIVTELARRRQLGEPVFALPIPWRAAALIALVAVGAYAQRQAVAAPFADRGTPMLAELDNPLVAATTAERIVTPFALVGTATRLLVAPVGQSPDYSPRRLMPTDDVGDPMVMLGIAVVALWLVGVVWAWRRRSALLGAVVCLPVAWFVPSNTVVLIGTIFGERLLLTPTVFAIVIAGAAAMHLAEHRRLAAPAGALALAGAALVAFIAWDDWRRLFGEGVLDDPLLAMRVSMMVIATAAVALIARSVGHLPRVPVVMGAVLACLAWCTVLYAPVWRSGEHFVVSVVARYPDDARFQARAARCAWTASQVADERIKPAMLAVAERHATAALELWPRQAEPYGVLGELARARGDDALARQYFRIARRWSHNENIGDAGLASMGAELPRRRLVERAAALRAHLRDRPGDTGALIELAEALTSLKRLAEAERAYRRVLDAEPDNRAALDGYLNVLSWTGQHAEALAVCRRLIALTGESWQLLTESALHAVAAGADAGEAADWVERAYAVAPDAPAVHFAWGQLHARQGEPAAAAASFERALGLLDAADPRRYQVALLLEQAQRAAR